MDDLAGVSSTEVVPEQVTGADPEYAGWDDTVPEAKVSGQTIPAFGFYVAQPFNGKLRDLKPGTTPSGRIGIKMVEAPTSAVDARIFDDLYLGVSKEKASDEVGPGGRPVKVPKTAAEIAKSTNYFQHTLNRLAQALGLALKHPVAKTEAALETYLSQFEGDNTPLFIVEVGIEPPRQAGQTARNRIKWDTARHPSEPAVDKALAAQGKTALDEARLRIAERNTIEAAKAALALKKAGVTAATPSVAQPSGSLD